MTRRVSDVQKLQSGAPVRVFVRGAALLVSALAIIGCSPTVKVEAPDKPIVINLNVKIEQEVRIRVEREIEDLLAESPDIF